jgi:2-dehydro-3-deoxygluconokinase
LARALSSRIVGFGELLLRFAPPDRRLIVQAQSMMVEVGGAEANVLAGLAALGHDSAMLSRVADNPLGRLAVATLAARGIDTNNLAMVPGRMGLYFLEAGQGLRASAITYDRAGSTFALAQPKDFDFASALRGARLLHLSGITPALGPANAEAALQAARTAKSMGVMVSFDGNYRSQLWNSWDSDPRTILAELVALTDILFGNHRDIALLTGKAFSGDGFERRREAVEAAFDAFLGLSLIASTAREVVNADHHQISARVDQRGDHAQTEAINVTGIVDRIGTGDAFAAGVLDALLAGKDCEAMARSGLALAVLKHSLPGDMPIFDRETLDQFWGGEFDVRR